jgi:hypothetical protein
VIEIAPGANAQAIQSAIDRAAKMERDAIVHIPGGEYQISATIAIPASSNLRIVGDGGSTHLTWTGSVGAALLRLLGPSKAHLSDLQLSAPGVTAIDIQDADQPGARVWLQSASAWTTDQYGMFADGLDHANVIGYDFTEGQNSVGIEVKGGPLSASGHGEAQVFIQCGSSLFDKVAYDVSNGGRLEIRDTWYASTGAGQFARLADAGSFTHSSANALSTAQVPSPVPAVEVTGFRGSAVFMNEALGFAPTSSGPNVHIDSSAGAAKVLLFGLLGDHPGFITDDAQAGEAAFLGNRIMLPGGGSSLEADVARNVASKVDFVREALADTRASSPPRLMDLEPVITDVRIIRVGVSRATVGVHVTRAM